VTPPRRARPYELVIFDFDGTLADTGPTIVWCVQKTFRDFGAPLPTPERIMAAVGLPLDQMLAGMHPALPESELLGWVAAYRSSYLVPGAPRAALYPGVSDLLAAAREHAICMLVASNKAEHILRASTAALGLTSYFDLILGDLPKTPRKPEYALYAERIQPCFPDIRPERILVVGDAWPDMAFAAAIGADSCYARYGFGNPGPATSPTHIIDGLPELAPLLGLL